MGAEAACLWKGAQADLHLVDSYQLPAELLSKRNPRAPSASHRQILEAAVAEGRPILVPPRGANIDEARPANPSTSALIFVPVRLDETVEYSLEVVHNSRGGPVSQRGYLRFVTQMSDLLADFLRRNEIREHRQVDERRQRVQDCLLDIAAAEASQRCQQAVDSICDILDASAVLLLSLQRTQVLAVSGTTQVDPRSKVVLTARQLLKQDEDSAPFHTLHAQLQSDLACDSLQIIREETLGCALLIGFHGPSNEATALAAPTESHDASSETVRSALSLLRDAPQLKRSQPTAFSRRLAGSVALLTILAAIGFIPIPQRVSATGFLQPSQRQAYYAPLDCIVENVLCREGQTVSDGQNLLRLSSPELTSEINITAGQLQRTLDRIREQTVVRDRGVDLSAQEVDRIESEILQLSIESESLSKQLSVLRQQEEGLTISARQPGQVATWDVQNRLLHRPVKAGAPLLSTFQDEGDWELQISIPERRAGMIAERYTSGNDPSVHFHLPSSPKNTHQAQLIELAATTTTETTSNGPERFLLARARLSDLAQLPERKDGALAQITIDCGRVPLAWLLIRDAYWALRSRIEMRW